MSRAAAWTVWVFSLAACIQRTPADRSDPASPSPHVGASARAPTPTGPRAPTTPADPDVERRVRDYLTHTPGAEMFADATVVSAREHDTPHARCVRVSPRAAPQPERAARVICVVRDQVLAGEAGFQGFLRAHQFDVRLARPAAEVLLRLRDDMLGLWGRRYTHVEARTENDTLVIDVDAEVTQAISSRAARAHWRLVIRADGSANEQ